MDSRPRRAGQQLDGRPGVKVTPDRLELTAARLLELTAARL